MSSADKELSGRIEGLLKSLPATGNADAALPESFGFEAEFRKVDRSKRTGIGQSRQLKIFARDHFIDRYTGARLFFPGVLLLLGHLFPKAFPTPDQGEGWRVGKCHWMYWRLWPTVDHVVPVACAPSLFDLHNDQNLVTTSQMINTAKSTWATGQAPERITFTPMLLSDAESQDWDGMFGWFMDFMGRNSSVIDQRRELVSWYRTARTAQDAMAKAARER